MQVCKKNNADIIVVTDEVKALRHLLESLTYGSEN